MVKIIKRCNADTGDNLVYFTGFTRIENKPQVTKQYCYWSDDIDDALQVENDFFEEVWNKITAHYKGFDFCFSYE